VFAILEPKDQRYASAGSGNFCVRDILGRFELVVARSPLSKAVASLECFSEVTHHDSQTPPPPTCLCLVLVMMSAPTPPHPSSAREKVSGDMR
jgi:hypothetical protein